MERKNEKTFLRVAKGHKTDTVPFWFMRQAGRYLPEYRLLREKAGSFLDLVYNPDFATEVTMQPLRRFNMDAAILFSDILVVPQALGQKLEFMPGEGPKLDPVRDEKALSKLVFDERILEPIYESIRCIRAQMTAESFHHTALIGFAGAPWTIATYMVEGGGSKNFEVVKRWAYTDPDGFSKLIDLIADATIFYLKKQIEAGAEATQLFDSWAGALDEEQFMRWVIAPTKKIVAALRNDYPDVPVIGFPRGSGYLYLDYAQKTGIDMLGFDQHVPFAAGKNLQNILPVQGNLDPVCLLSGGQALQESVLEILDVYEDGPFVFNLGHGVIKETPPEHVAMLSDIIRGYKK